MNKLDYFFLNFGLLWSVSKLLSYILFLIIGLIFMLSFRKLKFKNKALNILKSFFAFLLPVSIYFAFFPIYEGDIYHSGIKVKSTIKLDKTKTLTIMVLPDCPFCLQSLPIAQHLIERNPSIHIEYIIAARPNEIPHGIADKIPKECSFRLETNIQNLAEITHGAFPTYCISDKGKVKQLWRTEHFGTNALDEIEAFFKIQ